INSAQILLNSMSEANPRGLANRSDQVGRNLMDHVSGMGATGEVPGFDDRYYAGRRPAGIYMPRYRNVTEPDGDFVRGYGFQGGASRQTWARGMHTPGVGAELKADLNRPGGWVMSIGAFGEMLPNPENRVTLTGRRDRWGVPIPRIECAYGENDLKLAARAQADAEEMLRAAGYQNVRSRRDHVLSPGFGIHEMGTARMGRDPATSVLNGWCQAHD